MKSWMTPVSKRSTFDFKTIDTIFAEVGAFRPLAFGALRDPAV
jgi:hypothetical protein